MRLFATKCFKVGALSCLLAGVSACASNNPQFQASGVEIEGLVTLDGKPLQIGMVQVVPESAMMTADSAVGMIGEDGRFAVSNVPVGNIKITVKTSHLKGMAAAGKMAPPRPGVSGAPQMTAQFVDVPKQYENAETSKLTATVVKGKNTVNLELKSK